MLLSRFWYIFLAVTAGAAAAAGLLGQGIVNQQRDRHLAEALRRDRFAVEAVLRLEARNRLDRIAFITVDPKFGGLLRQAGNVDDDKRLREIGGQVKELMRSHYKRLVEAGGDANKERLEPDIAFALDRQGRVVAQLGPMEANPPGASLETYPLVRRALQGYLRDDVWVYDRRVYRMAARPVVSGSEYAGAILHGYRFDNELAEQLSRNLDGASVAFFHGTRLLGAYSPPGAPTGAELAAPLAIAIKDPNLRAGKRTTPIELESGGRATYSLVAGSAAMADVGYAIGRPRHLIASPVAMFEAASKQDLDRLPQAQIIAGTLLAAMLGLMFIWLERDRPLRRLMAKTRDVATGSRDRLIVTEWRGRYRRFADQINNALDKTAELAHQSAPTSKGKANLDEILGPTPGEAGTPFFGFADEAGGDGNNAGAPDPFDFGGPKAPAAAASAAIKPAAPAPPAPPAPAPPPPAAPPMNRPGNGTAAHFDEERHFQEVFDEYLALRKQCGESTDALTFERFGITLRKTRDQIISKHGAKAVRFTVYAKQGKAALKASPLKD